jgi:hypothetical protein
MNRQVVYTCVPVAFGTGSFGFGREAAGWPFFVRKNLVRRDGPFCLQLYRMCYMPGFTKQCEVLLVMHMQQNYEGKTMRLFLFQIVIFLC